MISKRNYGIDILRLVMMFMICILHCLNQGGILTASIYGTSYYMVFWLLEIICYCAVDGFAFISGYTAKDNFKIDYTKLINMWFQVLFYSFILTIVLMIFGFKMGGNSLIYLLFPVTSESYWYFTAYFVLEIVKPFLNKMLFMIEETMQIKCFIVLFLLFSCQGFITNSYKTMGGYSAIWIIVIYCMGVLAQRAHIFMNYSNKTLILIFFSCIGLTYGMHIFLDIQKFINYDFPTILICGIVLVILFSRINKYERIAKYSYLAFGIYLFQLNKIVWNSILKDAFISLIDYPIIISVILCIIFSFIIFIIGLLVEKIRCYLFKRIRIDNLSRRIFKILTDIINKIAVLFEYSEN